MYNWVYYLIPADGLAMVFQTLTYHWLDAGIFEIQINFCVIATRLDPSYDLFDNDEWLCNTDTYLYVTLLSFGFCSRINTNYKLSKVHFKNDFKNLGKKNDNTNLLNYL